MSAPLCRLAFLVLALAAASACRRGDPAPLPAPAPAPVPAAGPDESENPDLGRFVDLRRHPFRPAWVGGHLHVGRRAAPDSLNNLLWSGGEARAYQKLFLAPFLLAEALDRGDGPFHLEPAAAEALPEVLEGGLLHRYRLRAGLTWEDGVPVTAHDYAHSFALLRDPDPALERPLAARRASLERVAAVSAEDDRSILVRFSEPYYNAAVAFGLEFTVVPRHLIPDAATLLATERHLSFGAYRVVHSSREELGFELRPEYRTQPHPVGPAYVERITYRFIRDAQAQVALLKSGDLDLATIPHDQYEPLGSDPAFSTRLWRASYPLPAYLFMALNHGARGGQGPHPLFADRRVRKAIASLIDRDRLCREVYAGKARPVSGPFFFRDADYDAGIPPVPFDPAAAARLLDEAGFRLGRDGWRARDGVPCAFEALVPQGAAELRAPVLYLAEAARGIGVRVEVRELPFEPVLRQRMNERDFDAFTAINSLRPAIEPDLYELLHSREAGRMGGHNFCGVAEPALDALIDAYRSEPDPARRLLLRRRLHHEFHEAQPFLVLVTTSTCVGINRRFANVKVHDLGVIYNDFVLRELWERFPADAPR
jgi:ABC-type transport system substrate-binding protein